MSAPIVMHLAGQIYWRGPTGTDFILYPAPLPENVLARFEANGWADLSVPLRKAIDAAKAYHETQEIAA